MFGPNQRNTRWDGYSNLFYNKNKQYLTRAVGDVSSLKAREYAEFYCVVDNHVFTQKMSNHVVAEKSGKCGCDICRYKYSKVNSYVPESVRLRIVGEIPVKGYGSYDKVHLRCDCCGKEFYRKRQDVWNSNGELKTKRPNNDIYCSQCASKTSSSSIEDRLLKDLQKIYPEALKETYFFKKLNGRGCYEGDIVIHSLKAVIECDGEWYHVEGRPELGYKERGYHHNKDSVIHAYGYRVYHVMSEELEEYYSIMLKNIVDWLEHGDSSIESPFDTYDNI